jgi:hypothetical protein
MDSTLHLTDERKKEDVGIIFGTHCKYTTFFHLAEQFAHRLRFDYAEATWTHFRHCPGSVPASHNTLHSSLTIW